MSHDLLFWSLSTLAVFSAGTVVLTTDVTRLALGLGGFFLALAGFFALFGFGFLALAEVFVYVGGVLVLVLFAIMLVHRTAPGEPELSSHHDLLAIVACGGVGVMLIALLSRVAHSQTAITVRNSSVDSLGRALLGPMLPQFELAGVLLLATLVAVIAINGGDSE